VRMMREQRGRHFDPVMLDAFLEVLSSTGPQARPAPDDPQALLERVLETYSAALERGDAETAEGAIAQAIEDELPAGTLHAEVIAPALARIHELWQAGEIDTERERLATGITRRILATLYRFMLRGVEPGRERVLVASVEGEEHVLGLQMVHDQLAAAGFQTSLDTDLPTARLAHSIERHAPEVLVVGATAESLGGTLERVLEELGESHPELPVLLGGAATGAAPGELQNGGAVGVPVLDRIDRAVPAVEDLLRDRAPALG
jgi:methanogenic corrinoid protein MtbC1